MLASSTGHVIAQFKGKGVGKAFEHEPGKHCVQRCPPTENKSRRHTSIISVAVLPIFSNPEVKLNLSEVEITTQVGSGPGGQHRNRTESAVRVRHKPTGLQVYIDGRDQHQNKRDALAILEAKVSDKIQGERQEMYDSDRKKQMGGGSRGDKVRTYNFINSRVVDHRLGKKTRQIKQIMKGQFDLLF